MRDETRLIEVKKARGGKRLFFDNGENLTMPLPVYRANKPVLGSLVDLTKLKDTIQREEAPFALQRAVQLLSQREYTMARLDKLLSEAGYSETVRHSVLTRLQSQGYLSDERFVSGFLRGRVKTHGPRKLQEGLVMKGVSPQMAKEAVEALSPEDIKKGLHQQAKKALGSRLDPNNPDDFRKALMRLIRRGYDYHEAAEALSALKDSD